ncbi:hypothetical protein [Hyalangium versicolor]|uniref:hypothetical protein n=1 Tax=Hyalangium versicolor TaxID=2861190 RepID=UPI001CCDA865|nr:hypothetical protein [Hyalangium versicolor]
MDHSPCPGIAMPLPRLLLVLAVASLVLLPHAARAASLSRQMTFQGRLIRADSSPETAPQDLHFALYATATGGSPLWEESHPATPVTNGYYAVVLGASTPLPASVLNGQQLYLGVSIVGQSELTPRLPVASVPYALRSEDSNLLEGRAAASFASSSHIHPVASTTVDGFMDSADKVKLNNAPTTYGNGLSLATGTLSVAFPTSGGNNGTANTAARSNHTHALTCTYRTATGNTSATVSTAYCATTEVLTGGGCTDLEASAAGAGITFGPTGVTSTPGTTPGGPGYVCRTHTTVSPTAYAICCRNVP